MFLLVGPLDCDFDFEGSCPHWSTRTVNSVSFEWRKRSGATPSSNTGPIGDHTTGKGTNFILGKVCITLRQITLTMEFIILQVTIFMLRRPVPLSKATGLGYSVINFQQPLVGACRFGTTCTAHQLDL